MFQQGLALVATYVVLTRGAGEHWSAWTSASAMGWVAALWVVGIVMVLANLVQSGEHVICPVSSLSTCCIYLDRLDETCYD